MSTVKIGIVGSRFQADCIAASVQDDAGGSRGRRGRVADAGQRRGVRAHDTEFRASYTDYREMLRDPHVEMVSITAPESPPRAASPSTPPRPASTSSARSRSA